MKIDLNSIITFDDGIEYLVASRVYSGNVRYFLLIDDNFNYKIIKVEGDLLLELNQSEVDFDMFRKLISMMNLNLDTELNLLKKR